MEGTKGGKYNIVETICSERAFRGIDTSVNRQVFIKKFKPDDEAFENEKRSLTSVTSPHVPEFIDEYSDENGKYIVTEWIPGLTLYEFVHTEGPLDDEATGEIIIKICEALSFFHWNSLGATAFLDLKPSNIILRNYAGFDVKRIDICFVDLEAARVVSQESASSVPGKESDAGAARKTLRLGSPYFTAPEVLFGQSCIQSDIYSIGVMAGYMITGREEYPSAYAIRGFWGEFIVRCTDPDPGKRYAGVRNVIDAVRDHLRTARSGKNGGRSTNRSGTVQGRSKPDDRPESSEVHGDARVQRFIKDTLNFRRSCIMVEGNPCFVSEMGSAAAGSGFRTGVFSLSERGRENLEYYFTGKKEDMTNVAEKSLYPFVFDHRSMYLHGSDEWTEKGLLKMSGEGKRLFTGTFKQCLELPLRKSEDVRRFVEWCMTNFDITLMNVERGDDPALINALLESCNYVVATPDSNVEDMESFRNYYLTLAQSGKLVYSKVRFVAWDYAERESNRDSLFRIVGKDKYLGEVFKSEARDRRKNRLENAGSVLDDLSEGQYEDILQKLIS